MNVENERRKKKRREGERERERERRVSSGLWDSLMDLSLITRSPRV